jgi:hypothetical protein
MPATNWYEQGTLAIIPSDIILIILDYLNPLYRKIHMEIERLNKTLSNIDKYYLSGNIIPMKKTIPYDPNREYSIKLNIKHFAILGYQLITCSLIYAPIEKLSSKYLSVGMQAKHRLEYIMNKTYYISTSKHNEYVRTNSIPIKIEETSMYISREIAVLALFIAGFKCKITGKLHYFETLRDAEAKHYSINYEYFQFFARENRRILETQIMAYNDLYGYPVFATKQSIDKQNAAWKKLRNY